MSYDFGFTGKRLPSMLISKSSESIIPINGEFKLWKSLDQATITLSTICARGLVVPTAHIVIDSELGRMTYLLSDVTVKSHSVNGYSGDEEPPVEILSLSFNKIEWSLKRGETVALGSNLLNSGGDLGLYI
jgi:type VI protein secretion system component Hcp